MCADGMRRYAEEGYDAIAIMLIRKGAKIDATDDEVNLEP
jgi:hypothetical protein